MDMHHVHSTWYMWIHIYNHPHTYTHINKYMYMSWVWPHDVCTCILSLLLRCKVKRVKRVKHWIFTHVHQCVVIFVICTYICVDMYIHLWIFENIYLDMQMVYDSRFHWKCCHSKIHQIQKLVFLSTNLN